MVYSYLVWLILDYWPFKTIHWWPSNHHLTIIIHGWFLEGSWVIGGIPSHHPAIRWVFSPEKKPSTCGVFRGFSRTPPFKRLKDVVSPAPAEALRPCGPHHVVLPLLRVGLGAAGGVRGLETAAKRGRFHGTFMRFIVIYCDFMWFDMIFMGDNWNNQLEMIFGVVAELPGFLIRGLSPSFW